MMKKKMENDGREEIGLVTPTPVMFCFGMLMEYTLTG